MTHEEFTGVTFNELDPPGTRISRSSEFSVVNSTEIALNIPHKAHLPYTTQLSYLAKDRRLSRSKYTSAISSSCLQW